MGCDIHVYPEYWHLDENKTEETYFVRSLCSDFDLGRNYSLFSIMAGVRGGETPVVMPRGLPEEPGIGWDAESKAFITVLPDHEFAEMKMEPFEKGYVSESVAKTWGHTRVYKTKEFGKDKQKRDVIYHPDFHSHSWLTLPELLEVRRRYIMGQVEHNYEEYNLKKKDTKEFRKILKEVKDPVALLKQGFGNFEYASLNGLIGMMFFMEKTCPNIKTRVVFWFDS